MLDQRVRENVHRYLSPAVFAEVSEAFRYHLSDDEYREFARSFYESKGIDYIAPRPRTRKAKRGK